MSNVTKWMRTDGFTEKDPLEVWLERDFTPKSRPTPIPRRELEAETITINIEIDPNVKNIDIFRHLKRKLVIDLFEKWHNKFAVARALGVTPRTVWGIIDENKEQ